MADEVPNPKRIKFPYQGRRDDSKYYKYHRNYGHHTGDATPMDIHTRIEVNDKPEVSRVYIPTISRGPIVAGNSNRAINGYARAYRRKASEIMVMEVTENPPIRSTAENAPITFFPGDMTGITFPHHDPLVISAKIAHCKVAHVFLDGGSSVNIVFLNAFKQLGVSERLLD
ncbi:unnamed protein product [Prunus armeniaca]